ncbi:MAG: RtcB family protein, partial [Planctomycetota bacterium]
MPDRSIARLDAWTAESPPRDVKEALERLRRAPDVHRVAVMPDVHLSKEVCVGTVVATERTLYPAAVGGDIGCGMIASAFDVEASRVDDERRARSILDGLREAIPIIHHPRHASPDLPEGLARATLGAPELERIKHRVASQQIGTLGRGNHFVELQSDDDGRLWAMIHSGSRGMGQAIRKHWESVGARVRGGLQALDVDSSEGRAYLADVEWALGYAEANRELLLEALGRVVADVVGGEAAPESRIGCHHNFVRRESHAGEELWVHRKGAISARDGEPGIIPGSMGSTSYHVIGRGCAASLASSSHGAGRRLSRARARRVVTPDELVRQMEGVWFDARMAHGLREEAPEVYKDVTKVMRAQKALTRTVRRLRPLL